MMHAIRFKEVHCIQKATCTYVPAVGRHRIVKNVPRISTVRKIASDNSEEHIEFSERHIQ
jgi:hypothetical protein